METSLIQENVINAQQNGQRQTLPQEEEVLDFQIKPISIDKQKLKRAPQVSKRISNIGIGRNNQVANVSPTKNQDGYKPIVDFIKNCCIKKAFVLHPSAMYESYLREYWYTATYNTETKLISMTIKKGSFELKFGVKTFTSICGFDYLEKGFEYDEEPSFDDIQQTMLKIGYKKANGPGKALEHTLYKYLFPAKWKLLMTYISSGLGGNTGSSDQLNYMHQLIAHGLINGLKLNYGQIIFNDLASKLNVEVRFAKPAYTRFVSLILEKLLGESYVNCDEKAIKLHVMGNAIFSTKPESSEVPITSAMESVCQCLSEPTHPLQNIDGIDSDGHEYYGDNSVELGVDKNDREVKTKSGSGLVYPKSKGSPSTIPAGHFRHLLFFLSQFCYWFNVSTYFLCPCIFTILLIITILVSRLW